MAITLTSKDVAAKRVERYWPSWEEFEAFYIRYLREKLADTIYYTDQGGTEKVLKPINHHPELMEYEVWMEGYAATGESGGATLIGKAKARNFAQACHIVAATNHLEWIAKENAPDYKEYSTPGRWDYDPSNLSIWGCKLYWSEEIARKAFG